MKSIKQIASSLNCSKSAIFQHLRKFRNLGISLHKFTEKRHNTLYFNKPGVYLIALSFRAKNSKANDVKSLKAENNKLHNKLGKFENINGKLSKILNLEKSINYNLNKRPTPQKHSIKAILKRVFN